ncbi:hypothetical protein [Sphingosinicella rhizophila]|uniref:Uncharacterized protein n=1 Tax=Sphingosinicella rhizophila TaxID=3050082 RepID=A0ABU3QAE1_9SPHN|nr:hypothetical protein [Sphingosinicella sp. GR2756]MDT9600367.1 hypothetical protein [Sphingosinicella sp. GR2756]
MATDIDRRIFARIATPPKAWAEQELETFPFLPVSAQHQQSLA